MTMIHSIKYICIFAVNYHITAFNPYRMAKIGYIMVTEHYDRLEEDRRWMDDYGCVQIIEERDADEKQRPLWSIHDRIDSYNELFPETKVSDVLEIIGALPEEALALRKSSAHVVKLQEKIVVTMPKVSTAKKRRLEREKTVINLYCAGHPIEEIWKASGFHSRSSVFRILNKHDIKLNRGKHSGPIKKWDERKNPISKGKEEISE